MSNWINKIINRFLYRLRSDVTTEDLIERGMVVGNNFNRMHGVILDDSHCWLITIGDYVTLAPRVHILAHDASTCHHLGYARIGRVDIGNNVFIGADTVVLPGVAIGDNCVIGANSTVTKSIPDNMVAAGNPAKVICTIEDYIERNKKRMNIGPVYDEDYTLRQNITSDKKEQQRRELTDRCGFVK